jgi:hypothetical protein
LIERRGKKMKNITKSVKVIGQVFDLLLGGNFVYLSQEIKEEYPVLNRAYPTIRNPWLK